MIKHLMSAMALIFFALALSSPALAQEEPPQVQIQGIGEIESWTPSSDEQESRGGPIDDRIYPPADTRGFLCWHSNGSAGIGADAERALIYWGDAPGVQSALFQHFTAVSGHVGGNYGYGSLATACWGGNGMATQVVIANEAYRVACRYTAIMNHVSGVPVWYRRYTPSLPISVPWCGFF